MRIECCCCCKQIVNYSVNRNDQYVTSGPATVMGPNIYSCAECSSELDEFGMFPEERAQYDASLKQTFNI